MSNDSCTLTRARDLRPGPLYLSLATPLKALALLEQTKKHAHTRVLDTVRRYVCMSRRPCHDAKARARRPLLRGAILMCVEDAPFSGRGSASLRTLALREYKINSVARQTPPRPRVRLPNEQRLRPLCCLQTAQQAALGVALPRWAMVRRMHPCQAARRWL